MKTNALLQFSQMLGVAPRLAEDALHSESAARAVLSRRNLFAAGAALAVGASLVGGPLPLHVYFDDTTWYAAHSWADYREILKEQCGWEDNDDDLVATLEVSMEENLRREVNVCWDPIEREITDKSGHTKRGSFDFWAQREGRGILFGTEY